MKKKLINVLIFLWIIITLIGFYNISDYNYTKIKEAKNFVVNHPELLPKKDLAKITSFGFSNLRADIYWLEAIQYVWWNAISSSYKKYLYAMLDLITDLNPYFEKPYIIWQLLLPSYNFRYENLSDEEQKNHQKQWYDLWIKWINNFCDQDKIEKILNQQDLNKIWTNIEYKNPCKSSSISFNQWFLCYYYLKDYMWASDFYKIASAWDDSLAWAKIMAAITRWKAWSREASILMFLTLAQSDSQIDDICYNISQELTNLTYNIFNLWVEINSEILKNIQEVSNILFEWYDLDDVDNIIKNNCTNNIAKVGREFNLYFLDEANKKFYNQNWYFSSNIEELYEKWFIDYIPIDYQQYDEYWIIYFFNDDTWFFDYKMWY